MIFLEEVCRCLEISIEMVRGNKCIYICLFYF